MSNFCIGRIPLFPYYIVRFKLWYTIGVWDEVLKFPYYIKFIGIKYIKINNVIGVRQLQEAKPERNCLTNHQHCSFQGANPKISSIKFKKIMRKERYTRKNLGKECIRQGRNLRRGMHKTGWKFKKKNAYDSVL